MARHHFNARFVFQEQEHIIASNDKEEFDTTVEKIKAAGLEVKEVEPSRFDKVEVVDTTTAPGAPPSNIEEPLPSDPTTI